MSILKSGFILASLTMISRIFGLFRELVIANYFGTNLFADVVNTAFKFPNLFRRIFGEGALSSVFVPIYSGELETSPQKASRFASEIYTILFIALTVFSLILIIFMPEVMLLIAPGFIPGSEKFALSTLLCRITIPYMLFISASALIGGIQNSHGKFAPFAFVPIILNIVIIISCFFEGSSSEKSMFVSFGIFSGGVFQLLFMILTSKIYKIEFGFTRIKNLSKDSVKFFRNMIPAAIGSSVTQINLFISQAISSFAPGAISILSYSDRIYQFPLSIIGICFGTILLPKLAKLYKTEKIDEALDLQTKAIKLSLFFSIGSAAGIIALSHPIMHIVYERGAFTPEDTVKTAHTIAIFAFGLPAFILSKVLTPVFYSKLDTKTPLKITIISIIANLFFNILLIRDFAHLGIAIGTSIASWINVALIIYYFKKLGIKILNQSIFSFSLKLIFSGALMAIIVYLGVGVFENIIYKSHIIFKFLGLSGLIFCGIVFFIMGITTSKAIKFSEIKLLFKR